VNQRAERTIARETDEMLAGVIFDMDGVVVDSHPAHMLAWKMLLEELGKNLSESDLDFVLDGHRREEILRHYLGELTADQVKEYGSRKDALYREAAQELKTIRGLEEFMNQLAAAGIAMAVASSAGRQRVEQTLEKLRLAKRFRAVVTGDDVVKHKPDPAVFLMAAQEMGVRAESILVCEDAAVGVIAAKSAGMKCLGIAVEGREAQLRQAGADRVVRDFREVRLEEVSGMF